jgi:hypothetical protein
MNGEVLKFEVFDFRKVLISDLEFECLSGFKFIFTNCITLLCDNSMYINKYSTYDLDVRRYTDILQIKSVYGRIKNAMFKIGEKYGKTPVPATEYSNGITKEKYLETWIINNV